MGAYEFVGRREMNYTYISMQRPEEPGRRERPPPMPHPTDDRGGSGPKSVDRYEDLRQRSRQIIDSMRKIDPRTAERYKQRTGE